MISAWASRQPTDFVTESDSSKARSAGSPAGMTIRPHRGRAQGGVSPRLAANHFSRLSAKIEFLTSWRTCCICKRRRRGWARGIGKEHRAVLDPWIIEEIRRREIEERRRREERERPVLEVPRHIPVDPAHEG